MREPLLDGRIAAGSDDRQGGSVILTLVIPDAPATREHPGRSAARGSPGSDALVRAGEALIQANPACSRVFTTIEVVFGKLMPDPLGYQPDDPIYEALGDVGVVLQPDSWSSQNRQDPSADFYVVTFTLEDEQRQPPTR